MNYFTFTSVSFRVRTGRRWISDCEILTRKEDLAKIFGSSKCSSLVLILWQRGGSLGLDIC